MPNFSCSTFTSGARQLVVQEALEMTLCLLGIVHPVVDAQHQRDVFVLGRRRNNHLLDRAAHVLHGIFGVGEPAGGFHHDLRAD